MRMPFISLFLLSVSSTVNAQEKNLFPEYNRYWEYSPRHEVAYYRLSTYDTTLKFFDGEVIDLYSNMQDQMTGFYKNKKKEGEFIFYYSLGHAVESRGMFTNNERTGVWKWFYFNGKPQQEIEFKPGSEPKVLFLNDETGQPIVKNGNGPWKESYTGFLGTNYTITGTLRKYKKHGDWFLVKDRRDTVITERYKNGRLIKGSKETPQIHISPLPYKFFITEAFRAAIGFSFDDYILLQTKGLGAVMKKHAEEEVKKDIAGKGDGVFVSREDPPAPKEGFGPMQKAIDDAIQYPEQARQAGIQGSVFVEFVVEKDGSLSNFKMLKGIGGGCDEEAMRVYQSYASTHKWKPGRQNGQVVRQRFTLAVHFKLP
jgi:TonB family protein